MVFIEHPNNGVYSQVVVNEEITDRNGSFIFWIEIGSVFRQGEASSIEPKSFSGDGYELRFRHEVSPFMSLRAGMGKCTHGLSIRAITPHETGRAPGVVKPPPFKENEPCSGDALKNGKATETGQLP